MCAAFCVPIFMKEQKTMPDDGTKIYVPKKKKPAVQSSTGQNEQDSEK